MFPLEYAYIKKNPDTNGTEQNPTFGIIRSENITAILDKEIETRKGETELKAVS
jgi:hypothetical protein